MIDHKTRLRVLEELSRRMDLKLNIIIVFEVAAFVPVLLHGIGLV